MYLLLPVSRFVSFALLFRYVFRNIFALNFHAQSPGQRGQRRYRRTHTYSYSILYVSTDRHLPHFVFMAHSAIFIRRCNQANLNNNNNNNKNNRRVTKMFIYIGAKGISMLLFALFFSSWLSASCFLFLYFFFFFFAPLVWWKLFQHNLTH